MDTGFETTEAALVALPEWFLFAVPALGVGLLLLAGLCALALWTLHGQVRQAERWLARLEHLDEVRSHLKVLAQNGSDLDLRRIEHALIELRDGQKRLDENLLHFLETESNASSGPSGDLMALRPAHVGAPRLVERIHSRMGALGYDRVQLVTAADEVAGIGEGDGEVFVEARRNGAVCKGKVLVREGLITDLEIKPSYNMFP